MERLAAKVPKVSNWPGLLVGDMAQARGGPMLTGHASHQVGLDADIWLTPMPQDTALARGARGDVRHQCGGRRQEGRRSEDLDARACGGDQGGRRRTRRSSVSSSTRRSRRRCAATPATTARGCTRCARGGGTTIISTSASAARPEARNARPRIRRPRARAAARSSTTGSSRRSSIRRRRRSRQKPRPPITMADLPAACKQVLLAP